MKHLLLPLLLAAAACAADAPPPAPVRDPFASAQPVGQPVDAAPAPAPASAPAAPLPPILPRLEAIARSGTAVIATFGQGARHVVVPMGGDFTLGRDALTFVSCQGEEVLLRDRAGVETRLQVVASGNPPAPTPIGSDSTDPPASGAVDP